MDIRKLERELWRAADRGVQGIEANENSIRRNAFAVIAQSGIAKFAQGYYSSTWATARTHVQKESLGREAIGQILESDLMADVAPISRLVASIHTTQDFPAVLSRARDIERLEPYTGMETQIGQFATRKTKTDLTKSRAIRPRPLQRPTRRPEGTDVHYGKLQFDEEGGLAIQNFEEAIGFTLESYLKNEVGEFLDQMGLFGFEFRRNRGLTLLEAIKAVAPRVTLTAAGGPDYARVEAAINRFAQRTYGGRVLSRDMSHIVTPVKWKLQASTTLNNQFMITGANERIGQNNPVYQAAQLVVEPALPDVLPAGHHADDWLAIDNSVRGWLEFGVLAGYEGGPKLFTKLVNVQETADLGSFENHCFDVKMSDWIGGRVADANAVDIIAGG